jgi:hypothetical protein
VRLEATVPVIFASCSPAPSHARVVGVQRRLGEVLDALLVAAVA